MKLLLVGNPGGTNVADSLQYSANLLGIPATLLPSTSAFHSNALRRHFSWRLLGHTPPLLRQFSRRVVSDSASFAPTHLLSTGLAPITAQALQSLSGIRRIAYLTDDPWNREFKSSWFMDAVLQYDVVYTTRRANLKDLQRLGCRDVRYLPFGYDPRHSYRELLPKQLDVFFAGGAEPERVRFLESLMQGKHTVGVAGDRWDHFGPTRKHYKGHLDPDELRRYTAIAHVNICMVRSANRDGHVMRSFEIPACGGCMVAQDTTEHRELFGAQGENVRYFATPAELVSTVHKLLADPPEQARLAEAAYQTITDGKHTYTDRLRTLLTD